MVLERKILGVMGKSAQKDGDIKEEVVSLTEDFVNRAVELASEYQIEVLLVTGAGSGYPFASVKEAACHQAIKTLGFSPTLSIEEADALGSKDPGFLRSSELEEFDEIVYLCPDAADIDQTKRNELRSRKIIDFLAKNNGRIVVIAGGAGTKREVNYALEVGMPAGVISGTGGAADEVAKNAFTARNAGELAQWALGEQL